VCVCVCVCACVCFSRATQPNWLADWWLRSAYLSRREPIAGPTTGYVVLPPDRSLDNLKDRGHSFNLICQSIVLRLIGVLASKGWWEARQHSPKVTRSY